MFNKILSQQLTHDRSYISSYSPEFSSFERNTISNPNRIRSCLTSELTLSQTSVGFLLVCSTGLLKTLWENEKLLVMSNFSFSPSVFYLNKTKEWCEYR